MQSWIITGSSSSPSRIELLHLHEVTGVEHLQLGADPERLHPRGHGPQHARAVDHDVVAARREVHRAAVERADLGPQQLHVGQALGRADQVGGGGVDRQGRLVAPEHEVPAHAGGEVEHDVHPGGADLVHDLLVELGVAGAVAGLGIAHVDVHDRRARLRRLDGRGGDLLGRDRHVRAPADRVAGAGDGTGDEGVPVQRVPPLIPVRSRSRARLPALDAPDRRRHRTRGGPDAETAGRARLVRMRATNAEGGLTVHAVAGTHTVLLGFDLADPAGCLGFGIRRTDHTEEEAYWLRGTKSFGSIVPQPEVGMDFSLRQHPSRASSGATTRPSPSTPTPTRVVALGGAPGALDHAGRGERRRDAPRPRTTATTACGSTAASPDRRPS